MSSIELGHKHPLLACIAEVLRCHSRTTAKAISVCCPPGLVSVPPSPCAVVCVAGIAVRADIMYNLIGGGDQNKNARLRRRLDRGFLSAEVVVMGLL